MPLAEHQRRVDAWISQFEEGYFHPLTNLARLSEEVGELAREVNHRFGQKTKKKDEPEGDLGMEMADILFVLICMANREGIDLDQAFERMMAKTESRDQDRWTRKREREQPECPAHAVAVPLTYLQFPLFTPTPPARSPAPPAISDNSPADRPGLSPHPPQPGFGSPAR